MGARRKGRELAVQALYQIELTGEYQPDRIAYLWEDSGASLEARQFAGALVQGTLERRKEIDRLIAEAAEHWRLDRIAPVDLAILRVATYELLSGDRPPAAVVINEAIEISKRYSSERAQEFVNGVLDRIAERLGVKETLEAERSDKHG
ncbi:MAG: transcription antitermination factor NusB [Candidatus Binatia bacterium]|nr:transcription antitermination factor NusB [Candidatus Binatia bacterium]